MVGPFMQGMLLMGVIYWYSKGMINMINEYYRSEFQKQLVETNPTAADEKTTTLPAGTDEIELFLKTATRTDIHETFSDYDGIFSTEYCSFDRTTDMCLNKTELERFLEITLLFCFKNSKYSYQVGRVSRL